MYNKYDIIGHRLSKRVSTLTHYGILYSFTTILIAQFIYNNFHYIIGATLTVIAICNLFFQIIISSIEYYLVDKRKFNRFNVILLTHIIINNVIILIFIPFFIWTVVLMYQKFS